MVVQKAGVVRSEVMLVEVVQAVEAVEAGEVVAVRLLQGFEKESIRFQEATHHTRLDSYEEDVQEALWQGQSC